MSGELARSQLEQLAASLEAAHDGAAPSIHEGLETLTLQALWIGRALDRALLCNRGHG